MAETPIRPVLDEPTVMWRMQRASGLLAHATIDLRWDGAVVAWFLNGREMGHRAFADWTSALRWSDQLRSHNWAAGWRAAPDGVPDPS